MAVVTILVAVVYGLPLRDPDGVFGPTYVRFPILLTIVFLADVLPRVVVRTRAQVGLMGQTTVDVVKERWPLEHVRFALLGLGSWYLSYVAFRNLKSFVPFVNHGLDDDQFASVDRWLFFGHDPAVVLHHLLGTGIAAHLLSGVYVAWLAFIPFTIAAALVFSRNVLGGAWFVTAMGIGRRPTGWKSWGSPARRSSASAASRSGPRCSRAPPPSDRGALDLSQGRGSRRAAGLHPRSRARSGACR